MIPHHKGEIPFITLVLPFLLGLWEGLYFSYFILSTYLITAFFVLAAFFILLNLNYSRFQLYRFRWVGGLLINALLFLFGWVLIINYSELNNARHFSKNPSQYLLIKINNEPRLSGDQLRFSATVEASVNKNIKISANGTLLINLKDSSAKNLYYGDELLIPANYTLVDPPFNPAEFNYKNYLAHKNIYCQSFLYGRQYVLLNKDAGNPLVAYSLRLRHSMVEKLKANMHDKQAIAVASTLILGYKADLGTDIIQSYSKTGTIHVLTVSGMHVAILFYLLNLMLVFLDKYRYGKLIKATIIILLIWYYSLLTGLSPAVCRAALMISMVIIGKTYNRYINTLNILAASAFILLLYDPFLITDVGFQLSYLSICGLVILQPVVYNWVHFKYKWTNKIWSLCALSISAQVITFPLSAYYFHQFPVYFLVSNLFVIIPVMVIMYVGIAYFIFSPVAFIAKILGYVLEQTILLMNKALNFIEHLPYAGINKIWLNTSEYLLLYVIIISLFYFSYQQKKRVLKIVFGLVSLLAISISLKRWNSLNSNNITIFNLRKHPGIAFKQGDDAVILSDLPDSDKNYKYSVQPCLDSSKITHVQLFTLDKDIDLPYIHKKQNLVQFGDKTLLIFNKDMQNMNLPEKLKVDYIYVSGNPNADIGFVNKNYQYSYLIIGADNSDRVIRQFQPDTTKHPSNLKILKRNFYLTLVSN